MKIGRGLTALIIWGGTLIGSASVTQAQNFELSFTPGPCYAVPDHTSLETALSAVVIAGGNGGLGNHMWATVVNRDGVVCAVAATGADRGDQWPGSRVISAQKANTANAFSRPSGVIGFANPLSTANIYSAVQPGGSLFGLQFSNPVNPAVAYAGSAANYAKANDPLVGSKIGGVNVFGGGLALYNSDGTLVGAIGVSGDTSCADHIIAWRVRHDLNFDNVPGGVSPTGDDNIIFDITTDPATGLGTSAGGFGHPLCGFGEETIAVDLPTNFPIGPNP